MLPEIYQQSADDLQIVCLVKGVERYVILHDGHAKSRVRAIQAAARWAARGDLSFTWYDASVVAQRIRMERSLEPEDRRQE